MTVRTKIKVPGIGLEISISQIRSLLCAAMGINNVACSQCNTICAIINNPRVLEEKVLDILVELAAAVVPAIGGGCAKIDPAMLAIQSVSIGFSSDGVSVDFNAEPLARAALCAILREGARASRVLERPAQDVATALLTVCPECAPQVSPQPQMGNFSLQSQTPTPTPSLPAPQSTVAPMPVQQSTTPWRPTPIMKAKSSATPAIFAGGVAIAVSALILLRRH